MGKASISIAISGSYNGAAVNRAQKAIERLSAKTAAANGSISQSWMQQASAVADAGGRIYNSGEKIASVGDRLTAGVTVPLVGIGTAAANTAIDFESSMSRVQGALDDPSADMGRLSDLAIEMGQNTVFSASEAATAMEELAKGGMTEADIEGGALATTMDLAAAGSLELGDAANTVVQAMGAFGLSADQSSDAANALAGAAAASSADVSDLTQGLSQVAAQASNAGWNIQDTTAVLAAFSDAGVKGSDAGTSLKTMLQRLAAPTGEAAAMMESLGINVRDSSGNMLGASELAQELQDKLGGLDSATRDAALQTIFGSDATRAATILMNNGAEGIRKYTDATYDSTAAQKLADSQMGETEKSIEEMKGAVETAGIALGGALAPAISEVAGDVSAAASAFTNLDDSTQGTIVKAGLLVAAAGPVMSVGGRLVKGVGTLVTQFSKVQQHIGEYADALTTTNTASMEAYQSNERLNKALEKNPAVKAAGGVEEYTSAVRDAAKKSSDYKRALSDLEKEQGKGADANEELVEQLQQEVSKRKDAADAAADTVSGYQASAAAAAQNTTAVKASATAMEAMSVAAKVAKAALMTIAPIAVISAITALVSAFQEAKQREEDMTKATKGLVAATSDVPGAVDSGKAKIEEYGSSVSFTKDDVDDLVQSQAELTDSIKEIETSAAAQTAQINDAYSTIQQYANQSDLTTQEQAKLQAAVQTLNDTCGTQIEVIDLANGRLADENGAITNVTDSLGDYVDAKLRQIQLDAQQDILTDLYEQQAEDIDALAKAQQKYNEQYQVYIDNGYSAHDANVLALSDLGGMGINLSDLQSALDATNTSIDNVTSSMTAQATAASGASTNVGDLARASSTVSTAMNSVGGDLDDFCNDLQDAGVSMETFNSMSDEELVQLVASWDGSTQSIIDSLDAMGYSMNDKGVAAADALSSGLSSGRVSVEDATAILQSAAAGNWGDVATEMENAGINLPDSVAKGISKDSYKASGATERMLSVIALKLTGGDVDAAAELLGHDIDEGLAEGIRDGTLSEDEAEELGEDVIENAKKSLDAHSPSRKFVKIGKDVDAGLAEGIKQDARNPLSTVSSLIDSIIREGDRIPDSFGSSGKRSTSSMSAAISTGRSAVSISASQLIAAADGAVSRLPGDMQSTGSQSSSRLASGVSSGSPQVSSSSAAVRKVALAAVSRLPGGMHAVGSSSSNRFANGISSGRRATSKAADTISGAARAMGNGDSWTWGRHLGDNFANGLSSATWVVEKVARELANAAARSLKFSVPDEGPWSGPEKGGYTSGRHLAENFASGMLSGVSSVSTAANSIAHAAYPQTSASAPQRQGSASALLDARDDRIIAWLDANLGDIISRYAPTATPREFGRMVNQVRS